MVQNATYTAFSLTVGLAAVLSLGRPAAAAGDCLGFAYEPYVGQWRNNPYWDGRDPLFRYSTPPWSGTYGRGNWSVARQLDLLAPYTTRLATYSAGVFPWNGAPASNLEDNAMVAPALAARNRSASRKITLYQGIYQQVMNGALGTWSHDVYTPNAIMEAEVYQAVKLAHDANAVSPGTMIGLVFTNEYVTSESTTADVAALIHWYKERHAGATLPIAVRAQTWGQVKSAGAYATGLKALIGRIDVVMANIYPSVEAVRRSVSAGNAQAAVDNVTATFRDWENAAHAANPKVKVVLSETGWPVAGIWYEDAHGKVVGSPAMARDFFDRIRQWANAQQVETYYFEAISEPYKANRNWSPQDGPWPGVTDLPPPPPQRVDGAEGHFGPWHYNTADANGAFVADFVVSTLSETSAEPPAHPFQIVCPLTGLLMPVVAFAAGRRVGRRAKMWGPSL